MSFKKLLFLLAISTILYSCSSVQEMSGGTTVTGFDFSEYTEKGFMFTPLKYNREYQSIGMVSVTIWPRIKEGNSNHTPGVDYGNFTAEHAGGSTWLIENLNTEKAIDEAYKVASDMGADAIIQFDIQPVTKNNGALTVNGIEVTGFAIDRENQ